MSQSSATPMRFTLGKARLHGDLCVPAAARGLVVFVHGSGSSRHSPRNQSVARCFNEMGLATLLFDLLTKHEQPIDEITRQLRFDIPLLSQRLTGVIDQLSSDAQLRELRIGLFGASTGAAAALTTAASRPADIAAVVSRGGRVDLAEPSLARVHAASLFIVGSRDLEVLELNRAAAARLQCEHQLVVVPGASHLFEEHGTLEEVARLAGDWFVRHLVLV
ncbi:MAG TPA: alpha/beta hydrolase [Pseudomonas sp.]|nr:alpha/beta hydrolase [Pseudomonas sp.]